MIKGIHHISLLVSSEKTLDFYVLLGFKEVFRKERKADSVVLLEGYGIQLEVFIDSNHPRLQKGTQEPLGVRHFALKVDSMESSLAQLELEHTDIGTDWQGIRYCYITDPDGNDVELHE